MMGGPPCLVITHSETGNKVLKRGRPVEPHADSFTTAWTCRREVERDIFYKECPEPIGTRRADKVKLSVPAGCIKNLLTSNLP